MKKNSNLIGTTLGDQLSSVVYVLRRVWEIAPIYLTSIVLVTLIQGLLPAALAWVLKTLIDTLTLGVEAKTNNAVLIVPWLIVGLLLVTIEIIGKASQIYHRNRLRDILDIEISNEVLSHIKDLDLEFFEDPGKQDLLLRAETVSGAGFVAVLSETMGTIRHVLQIISLLTVLTIIQPWILVAVAVFSVPFLISRWSLARLEFSMIYHRATKQRWTTYYVALLTNYLFVAETKLLGLAPLIIRNYRSLTKEFAEKNRGIYLTNIRTEIIFGVLITGAMFGLLIDLATSVLNNDATIGGFAVFFGASMRLRGAILNGVAAVAELKKTSLQVSTLMDLLQTNKPKSTEEHFVPQDFHGHIKIEDLCFAYQGSKKKVLDNLSIEIAAGETVALVGENGCGKTTLLKLITKLYEPTRGRILLDGSDIDLIETKWLQQKISFVFQYVNHYEATAADNLAYGDWENIGNDREKVKKIARRAGVHDLIEALPDGYETMLGKTFGQHDLSLGQWQKLAVARAFAKQNSMLIFDEPTASIDARAEFELFSKIKNLSSGRTTLLVSHRFSTVSMADRILVMANGSIVEQGSHKQLLEVGGHYAELFRLHTQQAEI